MRDRSSRPHRSPARAWRWTLIDMGILAILPLLDIAVAATVAVRRARI